mmetsp:Transcript_25606/g.84581  ORF Transcript_25606/g.84581 Transcript_25606/m.84581 type:complete len:151 (-) Transcript_25606:47-499(-)
MALLEAYEEQYQSLVREINLHLDRLNKLGEQEQTNADEWNSIYQKAKHNVEDAEEVLGKLGMEVRSCKGETRKACENRLRQYKIDIGVCKDTLSCYLRKQRKVTSAAERDDLFRNQNNGDKFSGNLTLSAEQRARSSVVTERLEKSTQRR